MMLSNPMLPRRVDPKWLMLAVMLTGCSRAPAPEAAATTNAPRAVDHMTLMLSATDAARIGVTTAALAVSEYQASAAAVAIVVDPQALFALLAERTSAESARSASAANLSRVEALFAEDGNASEQELDVARAQRLQDEARATAVRRQLQSQWGERLAGGDGAAFADRLADGRLALIRIEFLDTVAGPLHWQGQALRLASSPEPLTIQSAWIAPTANPTRPGATWLALVATTTRQPIDSRGTVEIEQSTQSHVGVDLPRSAIVYADSGTWVYVAIDDTHYQRRAIALDRPTADGYFADQGFRVGERVVTAGAGLLLAEQIGQDADDED